MSIKTAERETVLDKVTLHSNKHQSKNTASSPPRPEDMSSSANSQCSVIDEFSPLVLSGTMDTFSSIEDEAITVESSSSRQDMCNTVSSSFRQDTASSPLRRDTIDVTDSSSSSEVLSEILQSHSSSQSNLQRDSTTRNYTAYKEGLTKGLTMKTLADICIQGNCNKTVVCQAVPTDITTNSVFIVDLEKVDYKDLKVDNLGIYEKHSKPTNFVTITVEDDRVVECKLANKADIKDRNDVIKIMRYYSYHAGLYGFKRIITTFSQSDYYAQYAVVQYIVGTNDPSKILVKRAHGNSKDKSVSFYRSSPSVQEKIIEEGKQQKSPKDIISSFQSSNSEKSFCISKEIRNRDQVYNLLKKVPMRKRSRNTGPKKDPELQKLIMLQKEGKYLKDVSFKSSSGCPNTFATTDNSLHWVKKFCVPTTKGGNCVLGIDMTFNVGPYYVTLCQVQLPLFVIKKQPYRHPSVIVGMMTSQSKTTNDYKYLANNFKEHGVKKLISGSDGEAALEKALDEVFPSSNTNANKQSIHLRDFDHLCGDMRGKLDEIGVSSEVKNTIVTGILGEENDGCRVNGLVDCETEEEFEIRYEDLKNNYPADFVSWLETRKGRFRSVTETLKKCMLKPVRVLAGLGNPPNKFSTNANEAQNNVLKDVVGRINTDQTELHEMVYEKIIKPQENELQRAIYKIGEYRLAPGFKKFEVEPTDWAKMSQQQKEKHVLNVFHQLPQSDETLSDDFKPLSVSLEDLQIKDVPLSTLYSVWRRAEVILHNHAVIDLQDSYYCVTEKHTSNTVNTTKGFSCSCKRYSLTGGLCEHCVVVAEKQQNLNHYLALFSAKSNKAFKGVASASKTRGNKPNQTQRRRGCNNSKTKPVVHEQQDSVPKVSFTEIYHNNNPFHIVLVKDEKKCIRCKSCLIDFNKNNPEVPFDLCLKHEERWLYPKLIDGKTQMVPSVSKTTNNFYCLKPPCVKKRHPYFYKGLLSISDDVARKMKSDGAYIEYMLNHFSYYVE